MASNVSARLYEPRYIRLDAEFQYGRTKINELHLTLSEAYSLYRELEAALRTADYPESTP